MTMIARDRPRVLLVAGAPLQPKWLELFANEPLLIWEPLAAGSFAHARFLLQHHRYDLLAVSSDVVEREGNQGLAWLARQRQAPIVFLGDALPEHYARAYDLGVGACLPATMALAHPPLLYTVMMQALQAWDIKALHERTKEQLTESRRHVDRLVQMIWRMSPRHDDRWYSQRHMLDRLDEELARCQRHHLPLSVAVAELQPEEAGAVAGLPDWSAEAILRGKRRSDVVGQYGPSGFLLLMVHTPKTGGVTCCMRLQQCLEHPAQELTGPHPPVRSYFGLASVAGECAAPQSLLRVAEQNLDEARRQGESRVVADLVE